MCVRWTNSNVKMSLLPPGGPVMPTLGGFMWRRASVTLGGFIWCRASVTRTTRHTQRNVTKGQNLLGIFAQTYTVYIDISAWYRLNKFPRYIIMAFAHDKLVEQRSTHHEWNIISLSWLRCNTLRTCKAMSPVGCHHQHVIVDAIDVVSTVIIRFHCTIILRPCRFA